MARILIVEDTAVQARHLAFLLKNAGHDAEVVENGVDALDAVRRARPDVVLTDMHMPQMNGLELVRTLHGEFPDLPVVMTTDRGSEDLAVEALRGGAAGYIPKRHLARDIVPIVAGLVSVTTSQRSRAKFMSRMTAAEYQFTLENDPELTAQVVAQIETILTKMELFDESVQMRLGLAAHEAVVNAMVHGNLEISSDLKDGDWEAYHAEIARRATTPPYSARRVHITLRADRRPTLEIRVRDEGKGYDPAKLPDPTDPANVDRACGRGLLLIRTFFDEVTHNAAGNEITMRKGG